jgi:hypothetical protein
MERINGQIKDQEELAKQVLSWITCAKRQLTTTELQYALGVEVGESELDEENFSQIEDIVSVCAGLVTVDEESGIIRLVHYTTQEYFERTKGQWFPNAQINITTICVSYLSFNEFESGICQNDEEFEQRLKLNKLYNYASHNWGHHAREASTLYQGVIKFLQKQANVEASSQALLAKKWYSSDTMYSQRFPNGMTGLHLAAYFGVEVIIQLLLDRGADVKAASSSGWTPLFLASKNGHHKTVQLLLNNGADVKAADLSGWTPLYLASENGHRETVQLLLDNGADVKAAGSSGWTPLHPASENGHCETVQLLLDNGADVKAADLNNGWTPLHIASNNGNFEIAQLLLNKGADVEAADIYGWTPLHWASQYGHREIVQLLKRGADVVK